MSIHDVVHKCDEKNCRNDAEVCHCDICFNELLAKEFDKGYEVGKSEAQ